MSVSGEEIGRERYNAPEAKKRVEKETTRRVVREWLGATNIGERFSANS